MTLSLVAADGKRATDPWGSALFGDAVGAEARAAFDAARSGDAGKVIMDWTT